MHFKFLNNFINLIGNYYFVFSLRLIGFYFMLYLFTSKIEMIINLIVGFDFVCTEGFPAFGADGALIFFLLFLLFDICWNIEDSQDVSYVQHIIFLIIALLFALLFLTIQIFPWNLDYSYFYGHLYINKFILICKAVIIIFTILFFITMYDNVKKENYLYVELPLLILFSLEGMFLLISSNDLFTLYLALELQSLALYIICSINRYSNIGIEAGLKYFILGSFSSAILLFGISLIYGFLGTTNYQELYLCLHPDFINDNLIILYFSFGCIVVGLLFKLAIFPFHFWISDVFEGSPNIITYFFALVPKISIFFVLFRIIFVVFINFISFYSFIILFCSIFSILIGSILALYQVKIKRFFAYSAIVHMGYILLSLFLGNWLGVYTSFYYLFVYLLASVNIFTIFLAIYKNDNSNIKNIVDVISILHSNPFLSFIFAINLLSLAGIPPFAGFYGKLHVFFLLLDTGNYFLGMLVVLFSVLNCVYYISLYVFYCF